MIAYYFIATLIIGFMFGMFYGYAIASKDRAQWLRENAKRKTSSDSSVLKVGFHDPSLNYEVTL